jgi:hypothetical protein
MRTLRVAAFIALSSAALVARAEALSIRDIMELSKAGLGDDVLIALIEVDRGVYPVDPQTLKTLKAAGVSERVIVAMVRSGRERPAEPEPAPVEAVLDEPPAPDPQPQVVVIEHREPEVREVLVPVYVAVPSGRSRIHRGHLPSRTTTEPFIPFQSGPSAVRPAAPEPKEPVYWGFGGKRRPDTWDPPPRKSGGRQ